MKGMKAKKYWSGEVGKTSNALDLEPGVFTWHSPQKIAASLKRSAEKSIRRKASPFQSAMSMLNFYINRAGKKLAPSQKKILEQVKVELRKLFGRKTHNRSDGTKSPPLKPKHPKRLRSPKLHKN